MISVSKPWCVAFVLTSRHQYRVLCFSHGFNQKGVIGYRYSFEHFFTSSFINLFTNTVL